MGGTQELLQLELPILKVLWRRPERKLLVRQCELRHVSSGLRRPSAPKVDRLSAPRTPQNVADRRWWLTTIGVMSLCVQLLVQSADQLHRYMERMFELLQEDVYLEQGQRAVVRVEDLVVVPKVGNESGRVQGGGRRLQGRKELFGPRQAPKERWRRHVWQLETASAWNVLQADVQHELPNVRQSSDVR